METEDCLSVVLSELARTLTKAQTTFVDDVSRNSDRSSALANDLLTTAELNRSEHVRPHVTVDLGTVVAAARTALIEEP